MSDEAGTGAAGEGGDAGGGEDHGWLSSIPENLREHEAIKGAEVPDGYLHRVRRAF